MLLLLPPLREIGYRAIRLILGDRYGFG